jgi:hypothetical protein
MSLPTFDVQGSLFESLGSIAADLFDEKDKYKLFASKVWPLLASRREELAQCYEPENGRPGSNRKPEAWGRWIPSDHIGAFSATAIGGWKERAGPAGRIGGFRKGVRLNNWWVKMIGSLARYEAGSQMFLRVTNFKSLRQVASYAI